MARRHTRDYGALVQTARGARWSDRGAAMQGVVDLLWDAFGDPGLHTPGRGYSWVGFYLHGPGAEEMTLAVRRNKPACSPIGLHGMCGRCWQTRRAIVVADVATLGSGYIACDPKDRSELVLPCIGADGACWGVLDADSWDLGAFDDADAAGATELLVASGLTSAGRSDVLRL